jgi:hypothetical protein
LVNAAANLDAAEMMRSPVEPGVEVNMAFVAPLLLALANHLKHLLQMLQLGQFPNQQYRMRLAQ